MTFYFVIKTVSILRKIFIWCYFMVRLVNNTHNTRDEAFGVWRWLQVWKRKISKQLFHQWHYSLLCVYIYMWSISVDICHNSYSLRPLKNDWFSNIALSYPPHADWCSFFLFLPVTAAGLPLWVSVAIVGGICTLYTAVVSGCLNNKQPFFFCDLSIFCCS